MLVTALPQVMRSHLQFRAVLDNAVIRFEMQKSSLKLNNIFVTVLRGTDCLEPCWSLDLEYFAVVLAVENMKIMAGILQPVLQVVFFVGALVQGGEILSCLPVVPFPPGWGWCKNLSWFYPPCSEVAQRVALRPGVGLSSAKRASEGEGTGICGQWAVRTQASRCVSPAERHQTPPEHH